MPKFEIISNIVDIPVEDQWVAATKFNSKDRLVDEQGHKISPDYQGRRYRIVEKRERTYSGLERFARGFLGVIIIICTLCLALFSKQIRNLFIKSKETLRFGLLESKPSNVKVEKQEPESGVVDNDPLPKARSISTLEIQPGKVTMGQGEYVVFHKLPGDQTQQLSYETFKKVHNVLLEHAPLKLIDSSVQSIENRYEELRNRLKEIDPTLEAVFVPKTFYELTYFRKCIEEDLRYKQTCPLIKAAKGKQGGQDIPRKGCWHRLSPVEDPNDFAIIDKSEILIDLAYRLNVVIIEELNPSKDGLTYKEWSFFVEMMIHFFQNHHKVFKKLGFSINCEEPGAVVNFGSKVLRGEIKPMGICNETDAQIIKNAIALECSQIAQHSLLLYRGSQCHEDSVLDRLDKNGCFSLSYGTGLFAGSVYDGGATAYVMMRENGANATLFNSGKLTARAVAIPFNRVKASPFFVPTGHTLSQLHGDGESFHARTKFWAGAKGKSGIALSAKCFGMEGLRSDLSKEELSSQFERYQNSSFLLNESL